MRNGKHSCPEPTYKLTALLCIYVCHHNVKKTEYGPRAREVEKATLTAAAMITSGGMGNDMVVLVRQIATKLSVKRGER